MMKSALPALLALCFGTSHAATTASQVTTSLTMVADQALEVRYDVPPGCTRLDFINSGIEPAAAATMRAGWKALDECATVDAKGVTLTGPACTSARLRVPASNESLDRVYPWAQPLEPGLFSHTSAFAVTPSCGPVQWRFAMPGGAVVVDGKVERERATRSATTSDIGYLAVVFLPNGADGRTHVDASMPADRRYFLADTTQALVRHFREAYPGIAYLPPFTVAIAAPDANNFGGDVAKRTTMRLMLPPLSNADVAADIHKFIAHENGHMLQRDVEHDRWRADRNTIMEGGADFISWNAASRLGWYTEARASSQAALMINGCLAQLGGKNWQQVSNREWGRIPYHCGMTLHLMGLAGRSTERRPERLLRDYYLAVSKGGATDFAQALECGALPGCTSRWIARALGPDLPFAAVVAEFAAETGLFTPATTWSEDQVRGVARGTFNQLMANDCKGALDVNHYQNAAGIATITTCATLRPGMVINSAGGKNLFTDIAGLRYVIDTCKAEGKVKLGVKNGTDIELACPATLGALPVLYNINNEKLFARLGLFQAKAR